jgi:hypothetical protein
LLFSAEIPVCPFFLEADFVLPLEELLELVFLAVDFEPLRDDDDDLAMIYKFNCETILFDMLNVTRIKKFA